MSENKVVLANRKTKTVSLPESKAEVEVYASIIAQDLGGISQEALKDKNADNVSDGIKLLSRLIKSWNIYESEEATTPRAVTEESVGQLPIKDLAFLLKELEQFITEEKKD